MTAQRLNRVTNSAQRSNTPGWMQLMMRTMFVLLRVACLAVNEHVNAETCVKVPRPTGNHTHAVETLDDGDSSDEDVGVAQALEEEEEGVGEPDMTEEARACFKCRRPAPSGVVCFKCGTRAHLACGKVRVDDAGRLWICPGCLEDVQVELSGGGSGSARTVELWWPQSEHGGDGSARVALSWNDVSREVQRLANSSARRIRSQRRSRSASQ